MAGFEGGESSKLPKIWKVDGVRYELHEGQNRCIVTWEGREYMFALDTERKVRLTARANVSIPKEIFNSIIIQVKNALSLPITDESFMRDAQEHELRISDGLTPEKRRDE